MHFVRGKVAEVTDAARKPDEHGKLIVQVEDTLLGRQRRIPVDMVVLMGAHGAAGRRQGTGPASAASRAAWPAGTPSGIPKLDPVATMTDGVFVAGVCQGPKDIPASVAQGAAAAARVAGHDHQGRR